jgi:sporulation protein YlmC with PRC-barrel domain
MKKLHSLAFYALVAPAITLGSGAVFAAQASGENTDLGEQSMGQDADPAKQSSQKSQDATKSSYNKSAHSDQKMGDKSGMKNQGYMDSAPASGLQASNLIGTDIITTGDEEVGSVSDLIIDKDGQVVAVVVGVGGFLGMGEKNVAIPWDDVTKSGTAEEQELRIDATREELQSAPEFVTQK